MVTRDHISKSFGQWSTVDRLAASHHAQATASNAFRDALLLKGIEDPKRHTSGDAELVHQVRS
ncbi:protein of unknown function [Streptomyces sp. KY75]|nr:protein of unknown function [Streptomyces sp. KY75]CAD5975535.1 protein of unknown function [Streptomyces sp. KY70]